MRDIFLNLMSYQDRYFPKFLSRNTERFYIFFVKWHKTNLLWGVVFIRRISEDFENSRHEACSNSLCRLSEIWPRRRKAKMCYHAGLLEFLLKFMKLVSLVFVFRFQQLHSLQIKSFEQKTHLKNTKDFFFFWIKFISLLPQVDLCRLRRRLQHVVLFH